MADIRWQRIEGQLGEIGGLKEKSLGAMRAGIQTVIFPKLNEKDLFDVPEEAKQTLRFVPVENVDEVLVAALEHTKAERDFEATRQLEEAVA